MLQELCTQCAHGGILFTAVAMRDDERRLHLVALGGKSDALPVISARRSDDVSALGLLAPQIIEVNGSATDLEGADRRVILVLYPHFCAQALTEQWPAELRGRRHHLIDDCRGVFYVVERRQLHWRTRPAAALLGGDESGGYGDHSAGAAVEPSDGANVFE